MTKREELTEDQRRCLDLVAELCLRGYVARPLHLAHKLGWTLERVTVTMEELVALELVSRNAGVPGA